jgi:hypothetical protein
MTMPRRALPARAQCVASYLFAEDQVDAADVLHSARVPSRCQSARPSTRCPTDSPVVP